MKPFATACLLATLTTLSHASGGDGPPLGPFPSVAPALPFHEVVAGRLGVIDSSFQRAYLVAAWRAIGGHPLSADEARVLSTSLLEDTPASPWDPNRPGNPWAEARRRFMPEGSDPKDDGHRATVRVDLQDGAAPVTVFYDNCPPSATRAAADALADRVKRHGGVDRNPWIAPWILGQDVAFSNCAYGQRVPAPAPADAPAWYRQDRTYQAAAALFHANRNEAAHDAFAAIAADASSPWTGVARYLAARSDLRAGSLSEDPVARALLLARAEVGMTAIANDAASPWRASARELLRRIEIERRPQAAFARVERAVAAPTWGPGIARDLGDFLSLARRTVATREAAQRGNGVPAGALAASAAGALAASADGGVGDWIAAMGVAGSVGSEQTYDGASFYVPAEPLAGPERERACGALAQEGAFRDAWAIVCVLSAKTRDDVPAALRARIAALPEDAPAWTTLTALDLRLHARALETRAAPPAELAALRDRFDHALAKGDAFLGVDGANLLRAWRAIASRDTLELATRSVVVGLDDPPRYAWGTEIARPASAERYLPWHVRELLSTSVPVSALADLAERPAADAAGAVALRAAWSRAALLEQADALTRLTPRLRQAMGDKAAMLGPYLDATDPVQRRYELARLVRRGAVEPLWGEFSAYGDGAQVSPFGWGCAFPAAAAPLPWLTEAQRGAAASELAALQKLSTTTTFVGEATVARARQDPSDPRLPGDLAEVVAATRLGCTGERAVSKAAFTTLHRLYPKSPEARRTKYYF
jgi:hypothetical protein